MVGFTKTFDQYPQKFNPLMPGGNKKVKHA